MFYRTFNLMFLGICALCALLQTSHALSYPLCTAYGSSWVTASPHLTGQFPYYQMLFSCTGDLNIEGKHVDLCIDSGTKCGLPAAQAFCEYLGFDGAVEDLWTSAVADKPALSMSGEWCVAQNTYEYLGALNRTQFDALAGGLAARTGPPCNRLDAVTCFRMRKALGRVWGKFHLPAPSAKAPASAPASAQGGIQSIATFAAGAPLAAPGTDLLSAGTAVGGRRRLRQI